ncbi:MAG TPA: serine/threonine-protein kinase [Kofleriaceae bacterium]
MAAPKDFATAMAWSCPTCGRSYPREFAVCPLDATPQGSGVMRATDPQIGVVIGRTYKIVRVLGQGGMARLYEAEHLRIDARFAAKIIHDDLAREPSLLARFEREAHAAGRIRSDHVVRIVDVLRTQDERPCIVTELLEGEDLQARLDRVGKLSVAEAIPIVRQLCRGVAAAHAVGVVHRDLKPSNVFLCQREGTPLVKVFDFGVAKIEDDEKLTRTGAVMGTTTYMAPEQARRAADAGPLADVYSIGAILYHMLAGEPPYGNLPAVSRFALLLSEEPARPRSIEGSIPPGVEAVIQHAMARDTGSRIASALELERQLAVFEDAPAVIVQSEIPREIFPASEVSAQTIALKARLARPAACFVAAASSVAAGAWLAALLGTLLGPTRRGERTLLAIIAIAAIISIATLHVRALRASWQSSPAVSRYIAPYARALLAGVTTFGALELVQLGWFSLAHATPLGVAIRLIGAGIATVLGLGWQRWRLHARLGRWIG